MRTVHKFLAIHGCFEAAMPRGAQIIRFADQGGQLQMWAIVDTADARVTRYFQVVGTGHEIGFEYNKHRGSCEQGPFIWHLFENALGE